MSKRSPDGGLDDAVNMDVMMDNMTDVVGTLLMVLIIVQLKVNNTINDIQSKLPEVTQQQVEAVQQNAAEQKKQVELAKAELAKKPPVDKQIVAQIQTQQDNIKHYETTLSKSTVNLLDIEKLEKQLEEKRKQVQVEKMAMAKLIDEREMLKGLLDQKPVTEEPPAKVVRMPAAREIPAEAQLVRILCANGRVYLIDTALMKKIALYQFNKSRQALVHTAGPITGGKDTSIYDHEKTAALLNKRKLGNVSFDLNFPVVRTSDRLRMEIKPKPSAGETIPELAANNSQFSNFLRVLKRNPKGVAWFLVHKDSFETYLAAREVCDGIGVPAGWEMTGNPFLTEVIYDFKVNQLEKPPPPNPNAVVIPAPKKTID
ncbi:MAG: hypothetical protein SFU86_04570 [Pirellulaceae bacterium]|nr:hypothetical protein [Pirellulaceae bacterium]